jgi:hypothetical protein
VIERIDEDRVELHCADVDARGAAARPRIAFAALIERE